MRKIYTYKRHGVVEAISSKHTNPKRVKIGRLWYSDFNDNAWVLGIVVDVWYQVVKPFRNLVKVCLSADQRLAGDPGEPDAEVEIGRR